MTTMTFHLSHSLAASGRFGPENNVVVTRLDHDANVSPWLRLAETTKSEVRWVPFRKDAACTLDLNKFENVLDGNTALVAVGYASNACGTINPIKELVRLVSGHDGAKSLEIKYNFHHRVVRKRSPNALFFVDAVHYAPHRLIDVKDVDCDFLTCSAYKFFGPHCGILYGKEYLMEPKEGLR